jgi:hypothetical protein
MVDRGKYMRIFKGKKMFIPLVILLGVVIACILKINMEPAEVLRNSISMSELSVNKSTSATSSASYAYFENYDQADEMADTIIIGDVIKVNELEELITGESTNTITGEKVSMSHVFTVSEIKVNKAIKGNYSPGDIIQVKQYGGLYKGTKYSISGENYFKSGERHIFFLQSYKNNSPCSPINPQQGDMLIVDGKMKKTNNIQLINDNVSETQAEKALKDKIENLKSINKNK